MSYNQLDLRLDRVNSTKIIEFKNPATGAFADGTLVSGTSDTFAVTFTGIPAGSYTNLLGRLKGTSITATFTGTVIVANPPTGTTKLDPPTGLAATPTNSTTIGASWNQVPNATGYRLQRSPDATFPSNSSAIVYTGTGTSYVNTGLAPTTTYYYRVLAEGNGSYTNSDYSAAVAATTQGAGGGTTPTGAPEVQFVTSNRRLVAYHEKGGTLLFSRNNAPFATYTGAIQVDNLSHQPNEWLFKRAADTTYAESPTAGNLLIDAAATGTTPGIASLNPSEGYVGDTVTLLGNSLGASAGQVFFANNVAASILNWSATQVQVAVPAGAVPGPLRLVTSGGTTYTSSQYFLPLEPQDLDLPTSSFGQVVPTVSHFGFINQLPRWRVNGASSTSVPGTAAVTEQNFLVTPFTPVGPSFGASVALGTTFGTGTDVVRVGIVMGDPTNTSTREFITAQYVAGSRTLEVISQHAAKPSGPFLVNGSLGTDYVNKGPLPAKPEAIGIAVADIYQTVWVKLPGSDWQPWVFWQSNYAYCHEFWREETLAKVTGGYVQVVSGNNAGATLQLGQMQAGYLKGVGAANWSTVKGSDGSFFQDGRYVLRSGSIAHVAKADVNAASANIAAANSVIILQDTETGYYEEVAYIWSKQPYTHDGITETRIYGHNATAWQYDLDDNIWRCELGTWGSNMYDPGGQPRMRAFTSAQLAHGPVVLDNGIDLTLPRPMGYAYDTARETVNGEKYIAYAVAESDAGDRYLSLAKATPGNPNVFSDPPVWTGDRSTAVKEAAKILNLGNGTRYVLGTNDNDGALVLSFATGQRLGVIKRTDTGQSINPTHCDIFFISQPDGSAKVFWYAYDGTLFQGRPFTVGQGRLLGATRRLKVYSLPARGILDYTFGSQGSAA